MGNPSLQSSRAPHIASRATRVVLALTLFSGVVGCQPTKVDHASTYYNGPTLPLDSLLARINENNARINTVNASGTFLLSIPNETPLNGQITLLFTKPDKIRILGDKDLAGRIFDLGTDGKSFWLHAKGRESTTWYGTNVGVAETSKDLPISPQLLTDVLGIATMSTDLLAQPVPTVRFNPDYDSYMLTWHTPIKDRWVTLREVWYDRATLQPRRIWLFDRNGRVVVRAKLARFEPMRLRTDEPSPPLTARSFDLFFPETDAQFTFDLDAVRDVRGSSPNQLTYRFNPQASDADKRINLDERRTP